MAIRCGVCRHDCLIAEGAVGVCGVRKNVDGRIRLMVYGKASSVCVDPVEKKPFFHLKPGTEILSVGSVGCNFRCCFCQNWAISQAMREPDLAGGIPLRDAMPASLVADAVRRKIPSIAFTYNEPAILLEWALDTFKLAKKNDLTTAFVSNGYASDESLKMLRGKLDAINIDLKAFSQGFYAKQCGASLDHVLATIESAHRMGFWLELTTLVIPGLNDGAKELKEAAEWIASLSVDIPWHLTAFHPEYKLTSIPATPMKKLEEAHDIAKKAGLNYVYVGNLRNGHENTVCAQCSTTLVHRSGFKVVDNRIKKGACPSCGKEVPGVW